MPAYVINQFEIFDMEKYKEYQKIGAPTIKEHGGRALAAGGRREDFEGETFPGGATPRTIILEFDTFEQAKAWYLCPRYQEAVKVRNQCARARVFIIDDAIRPTS